TGELLERKRANAHAWIQCHRHTTEIAELHGGGANPAWLEYCCGAMHGDSQSGDAAAAFESAEQIVWQLKRFHGRCQGEIAGLQDKSVVVIHMNRAHGIAD